MRTKSCAEAFYRQSVLFSILISLNLNFGYLNIARRLNDAGIKTPTGMLWNASHIKNLLRNIRNPSKYQTIFRAELDQLINNGVLSAQFARPLLGTE
jgi:hypothetical protein